MMKRSLLRGVFVVVCLAVTTWALAAGGQQPENYVPGQVIIKLNPSTPPADAMAVRTSLNATVERRFESVGAELWKIGGIDVPTAVSQFKNDPRIAYIEPNYLVHAEDVFPNDPRFTEMWALHNTGQTGGTPDADIDAPEAWSIETGDTVLVGVIDTGVDWHHVELAANIYTNPGEIPSNGADDDGNGYVDDVHGWDFVNGDNDPYDDNGHGTHVSGTIAAVGNNGVGVVGVSWSSRILPLKFLDAGGSGWTSDAILAVEYATAMGVRLTNNSWGGGGFSSALRDAIEAAGNAGILFVAAAGNSSENNDLYPHYPSSYDLDNIIAVASTDHYDQLSWFSCYGLTSVDLAAPGSAILSTLPGNSYGTYDGTSMATPHVSGAVCLLLAAAPMMTHVDVKNTIMSSVDVIPALQGKMVAGGRLNVYNMLSGLDSIPPAPVRSLAVQSTGSNTVTLTWTATGDDGAVGTAFVYDLRYSTSGIYWSNFDSATPVLGVPRPKAAGSPESFMVTGLDFNTKYFFGLVVEDEQGNRSWLSNLSSGRTLGIPQLAYSPDSFAASLLTGGSSVQLLTIGNTGEGTLDFAFPGALVQVAGVEGAPAVFPTWLRVAPSSGRVNAGGSLVVEVTFDATGMYAGDYAETIVLETNDPGQHAVPIPVSLHVTNAPDVAVSPSTIDYGVRYTGTCVTDTVVVTNIGTEPLVVSGLTIDNGEFSTDPSGFVLGIGQNRMVLVTFCPVTIGVIEGTLAIQSNDPDHPTYSVPLRGQGVAPPVISVSPDSFSEDLYTGQTATHLMTISNLGGSNLEFDITTEEVDVLGGSAVVRTRISVPRSSGEFPRGTYAPAVGPAPENGRPVGSVSTSAPVLLGTNGSAFSTETAFNQATRFSLGTPEVLNFVGAAPTFIPAGDFSVGDNSFAYALNDINEFMRIDTLNGAQTILGTLVPYGGESWTGMALDPKDGTMYATSTNIGSSSLYIIDVEGPAVTRIGSIGFPGIIALAVDKNGNMYAEDIVTDELVAVNKTTGAGTAIGSLGFDANYAQGMAFDPVSEELYLAAFNNYNYQGELRIADRTTGATALVGVLGATSPGSVVELGWLGIPGLGGVQWLVVGPPDSGIVPPGASMDVAVQFVATGMNGGDYDANILVASNDPITPLVEVPAHLHVTGAPDIAVSDTVLNYGPVYIGAVANKTLVVKNEGTDELVVSGISSSHGNYAVDVTSFNLAPGAKQDVVVSFAPTTTGPIPGTLTITSNDVDEGVVEVELWGEGLVPPVISVTPDSLADSLFTGQTSQHTLSIGNSGGSNLVWSARPVAVQGLGAHVYTLTVPVAGVVDPETGKSNPAEGFRTAPISATLKDLTDVAILVDYAHGEYTGGRSVIFADVTARGATVTENFDPITPALLEGYDLMWVTDFYSTTWTPSEIQAVQTWFLTGGALLFESDETQTGLNTLLAGLGTGITYLFSSAVYGVTTAIYPHETTQGVSSAYLDNPLAALDVAAPAGRLVDDMLGNHAAAYSEVASGRIFAVSDEIFTDWTIGYADNQLFTNQVIDWLSVGVEWLSVTPTEGTVAPGGSEDVTVTFDATGQNGGDYDAMIVVANNDPLHSEVLVPAHLHVTGAPDIAVSDTVLNYGPLFIGVTVTDTLAVSNEGTDVLVVSEISSSDEDYAVDVTSFNLAPGASQDVVVSFTPRRAGPIPGTLTITSNDPDEPVVEVSLKGEGLVPPVISVTPDSLADSLFTGQTSTHALTISNTGGSDLNFSVAIGESTLVQFIAILGSGTGVSADGLAAADRNGGHPSAASLTPVVPLVEISRGQQDTRTYPPMNRASGGPDPFGYRWRDSNEPGGPSFEWIDVSGGTPITLGDFDFRTGIPLGFTFSYYGQEFTTIGVGSKGWLSFNGWNTWYPSNVPQMDDFAGAITPFARDLYPPGGTYVRYQTFGTAPTRRFVVEYNHIPDYPSGGFKTFEVIFYERANAIRFQYLVAPNDPHGFGIESPDQTMGMGNAGAGSLFISPALVEDNYAIEFAAAPLWLGVDPLAGTVPAGGNLELLVSMTATPEMNGGDYDAQIAIGSNDPVTQELVVPVKLHVTGAPDIALSDTLLNFGSVFVGAHASRTIAVGNLGNDDLVIHEIASTNPDVTFEPPSLTVPPSESRDLTVTFAPTTPGAISDVLTISSNDPDEGEVAVAVLGQGLVPPEIVVAPDSLSEALFSGETSTQTLTIGNPGGSPLTFSIGVQPVALSTSAAVASPVPAPEDKGKDQSLPEIGTPSGIELLVNWLSLAPTTGGVDPGSSAEITVAFNAINLVGGIYHASIVISTNVPTQPTVSVPVDFDVTGAPSIAVSDTLLDFGVVFIGYTRERQFIVTNLGTDMLAVSEISADDPSFSPTPTSFDLAPLDTQIVTVTHTPTEVGPVAGVLAINSNDPKKGTLEIDLTAEDLEPPLVSVSPDSIRVSLAPGEIYLDTLYVSNLGGSDLVWNAETSHPSGMSVSPLATVRQTAGAGPVSTSHVNDGPDTDTFPGPEAFQPLTALKILWHGDHGWGGIGWWSVIVSDLTARGATVTESSAPIDGSLLAGVHVLWFGNRETPLDPAEIAAIAEWLMDGRSILFEADSDGSRIVYNELLENLGSGIAYWAIPGYTGPTTNVYPHDMTVGVGTIYLISALKTLSISAPAGNLIADLLNRNVIGYDLIGDGRIVVMADHTFHDVMINVGDARLFANQVFTWLLAPSWLTVTPASGTLGADETVALEVAIDATALLGGDYQRNISIRSNDPATPVVSIPVYVSLDSTVISTGIDPSRIPTRYELYPNRPNPFNPTTTITYDLRESAKVRLVIYDVRGKQIRELVSTTQPAGCHEVIWDGRNAASEPVASGVYFYRLIAGDFVQTRKMVLLK